MPIIKSAIKKLRQDRKKTIVNNLFENRMKSAFKNAAKTGKEKDIKEAISLINKAAKKNIIHKNKAARLTSQIAKKVKTKAKTVKTPVKKSQRIEKK
ncbi:30S ribosomal protein S20 [Candidatus Gottesmanbacteria bacterium]|nr:30S ribosomal protein S20 [Candidatus Gottesmanbacteria bacterium]